jgi:hypothetical protein
VVETAGHALGEEQRFELAEQRIAQGELALKPPGFKEKRLGGFAGGEVGKSLIE